MSTSRKKMKSIQTQMRGFRNFDSLFIETERTAISGNDGE